MSDNGKRLLLQKAGPGGYDIYVEPDALRAAANALRAVASDFQGRSGDLPSRTHLPRGAFGVFPAGQHAMTDYDRSRGDAPKGMAALHQTILDAADKLHLSAANYDTADEASAAR